MRIVIETIPHDQQRYPTLGDYADEVDGTLVIKVSETGDRRYDVLIAIHEMIEAELCRAAGIAQAEIDAFDMRRPDLPDPGMHPDAPYRRQHLTAMGVEMMVAAAMGVDWQAYEDTVGAMW